MAIMTIRYDGRNKTISNLLSALVKLDGIEDISSKKRDSEKNGLDKAIEDFENGNTTKCNDFEDYLKKINA